METNLKELQKLAYEQSTTYQEYLSIYERLVLENKARVA